MKKLATLFIIFTLGLSAMSATATSAPAKHQGVLGYASSMSISELLADSNYQRAAVGEGYLHLNSQLDVAAQAKANDMVNQNYWSHYSPSGASPWTFIVNSGYSYSAAGENLAYGFSSASAVITAWMNSAEHRANLLNGGFVDVGFGVANSPNYVGTGPETIVVAEYGTPLSAPAPAPSYTAPTSTTTTASTPTTTSTAPVDTTSSAPSQQDTSATPAASTPPATPSQSTPSTSPVTAQHGKSQAHDKSKAVAGLKDSNHTDSGSKKPVWLSAAARLAAQHYVPTARPLTQTQTSVSVVALVLLTGLAVTSRGLRPARSVR